MNHARICLLAVALVFQSTVLATDLAILSEGCDGCHGPNGVSADGDIPTIAGQSAAYIAGSLESFQQWGRPCKKSAYRHGDTSRPATSMCEISSALNGEDILALGNHYAQQAFVPARQDIDTAKVPAGEQLYQTHCESCHPEGGKVSGRGPILAGQWMPYLKTAVRQSVTGEHLVPPLMEKALADFSDAEIDALMNYFASQQD